MLPILHRAVVEYANLVYAIVNTGVRAHAGHLVLAKATSAIQQARLGPLVWIAHVRSCRDTARLPKAFAAFAWPG